MSSHVFTPSWPSWPPPCWGPHYKRLANSGGGFQPAQFWNFHIWLLFSTAWVKKQHKKRLNEQLCCKQRKSLQQHCNRLWRSQMSKNQTISSHQKSKSQLLLLLARLQVSDSALNSASEFVFCCIDESEEQSVTGKWPLIFPRQTKASINASYSLLLLYLAVSKSRILQSILLVSCSIAVMNPKSTCYSKMSFDLSSASKQTEARNCTIIACRELAATKVPAAAGFQLPVVASLPSFSRNKMRRSKKPNGSSLWAPHQLQTLEQVNIFFKTWRRRDRDHHLDSIVSLRRFTERRRPNTGIIRIAKTQNMIPLSLPWSEWTILRAFGSETRTLASWLVMARHSETDVRSNPPPCSVFFFFWGGGRAGREFSHCSEIFFQCEGYKEVFVFLGRNVPKSSPVEEFSLWNRHI